MSFDLEKMDEDFKYFYVDKGFSPATHVQAVPDSIINKYRGKLPDQLMTYWEQYGFAGYGKGLFWVVNPDEYADVLDAWLGETHFVERESLYVIARSAFGELFLWGNKTGACITISSSLGMIFPGDDTERMRQGKENELINWFFSGTRKEAVDNIDTYEKPMFDRAYKLLGELAPDEMYGFEPALVLGGKAVVENLRKVKAVEHLIMLAQMDTPTIMRDIVAEARALEQEQAQNAPPAEQDTTNTPPSQQSQAAGLRCPKAGYWYTLAKQDSRRYFSVGDVFPDYPNNRYGSVFWMYLGE